LLYFIEANLAHPCDEDRSILPSGSAPLPWEPHTKSDNPWDPFNNQWSFNFAYQEFVVCQNSEAKINEGLDILLAAISSAAGEKIEPIWNSAKQMYETIDSITEDALEWKQATFWYNGKLPQNPPCWMLEAYTLSYRNSEEVLHEQMGTPDFDGEIDYVLYMEFNEDKKRVWSNLMSGNWAYKKAICHCFLFLTFKH